MDTTKYLNALKKTAGGNWKPVNENKIIFKIALLLMQGFDGMARLTPEQWNDLGQPPVTRDREDYYIDLSDKKVIGLLLAKASRDAMKLACYAATDITDAVMMLNNDNMDGYVPDREALCIMSGIISTSMDTFQKMDADIDKYCQSR